MSRPTQRQASKRKQSSPARARPAKVPPKKAAASKAVSAKSKTSRPKTSRPKTTRATKAAPATAKSAKATKNAKATKSARPVPAKAKSARPAPAKAKSVRLVPAKAKSKATSQPKLQAKPSNARTAKVRLITTEVAKSPPRNSDSLPVSVDPAVAAYESEALSVLASEFPADDPSEADAKIERRLRDKKLGDYDRSRIEALRAFKTALADEIHRGSSSSYFTGSHGLYANPEDFDHARLAEDFAERYPDVSHEAVAAFIPIAVYCYYLR